jgi:hypothetical protein
VDITPNPTYLRLRQDLMNFQRIYQQMLGMILKDHPNLEEISLSPAVPAPVAVLCIPPCSSMISTSRRGKLADDALRWLPREGDDE